MGKIFSNFSIQFFKHDFHFKLYIRQRKCFYQIVQQYLFEKLEHLPYLKILYFDEIVNSPQLSKKINN